MMRLACILALAATLTACGDKAQTLSGTKHDGAAFEGTTNPYNAPGWKAGDKTSWAVSYTHLTLPTILLV